MQTDNTSYAEYVNTADTVTGWISGTKRYHLYNGTTVTCEEESAAFLSGLTIAQQIAATTDTKPVPAGFHEVARTCDLSTPTVNLQVVALNADFTAYPSDDFTLPPTTPPDTSSPTISASDQTRFVPFKTYI